jgi:hypothetical protein
MKTKMNNATPPAKTTRPREACAKRLGKLRTKNGDLEK